MGGLVDTLLSEYGLLAVFAFVGIESLGIPLPGETMLITAAVYSGATGKLEIELVLLAAMAGAIIGDNIGYGVGRTGGLRLLRKYGKYVRIDERRIKLGRYLFLRHGGKVVFFGRFTAVLRTYAAFLAGTLHMEWKRFLFFNAAGGILWSLIFGLGAYWLGTTFEKLSTPANIAFGVIGVSVAIWAIRFAHKNAERLEEQAERALPGPLE
jgi:membrane protein DedA with SNARE-associated domain